MNVVGRLHLVRWSRLRKYFHTIITPYTHVLIVDVVPVARVHYFGERNLPIAGERYIVMQFCNEMRKSIVRIVFFGAIARQRQVKMAHSSCKSWVLAAGNLDFRSIMTTRGRRCYLRMTDLIRR